MTGMDDLIAWLRRQLDADERVAREAPGPAWLRAIERDGEPGKWRGVRAQLVTLPPERPHPLLAGTEVARSDHHWVAEHIARWDPARVLAEIDAKRKLLDWLTDVDRYMDRDDLSWHRLSGAVDVEVALRLLALPYAERDGWREEWRPE